MSFTLIGFSVK